MATSTRWAAGTEPGHSQRYLERMRQLAADGVDLAGEARMVDAIVAPGSRILDAGCGSGRVGAELARRGHGVVGVDADEALIEAARRDSEGASQRAPASEERTERGAADSKTRVDHPGCTWVVDDLAELDLAEEFDAIVVAGNVMVFVAPGTEGAVLRRLAAHVKPGGPVIVGFATDRDYPLEQFHEDAIAADLVVQQVFATWNLLPWYPESDFAVTVLRRR